MVSTSRGNTGESQSSEVPAIYRVQKEGSCTKKGGPEIWAQVFPESLNHTLHMCKVGSHKTWQRATKGCELTGESGVDTVVGDTAVQTGRAERSH